MEKTYRIVSKIESPTLFYSDLITPKTIYTLLTQDGKRCIHASLERRHDWTAGSVVKIEEDLVQANLVE